MNNLDTNAIAKTTEVVERLGAEAQAAFEVVERFNTALYQAAWLDYRAAGLPLGSSDDGLCRWLDLLMKGKNH